ncbi:MAG: diaminopimelate epimerase [Candidatus Marinimicrobia bacterium CG08_land_8_20_14_0_20_45_22]|nr:MAG: diaminopimelate epimerase [Candidatus Marinimicrobia bacterium CG08_land_8_20_14_0_20_45_22]
MQIHFWKITAAGNDFVLIDDRPALFQSNAPALAQKFCDRRFGIGGDGTIFIRNYPECDFEMAYFNPDGSGPAMCGNGSRAAVLFVHDNAICVKGSYRFLAADGEHSGVYKNGNVAITVRKPIELKIETFNGNEVFRVDTGVPHLVVLTKNLAQIDIRNIAPKLRKTFDANVNFIEQNKDGRWAIRTYERGVEDETLACGTGATAAAYMVSKLFDQTFPIRLIARGGELQIDETNDTFWLSGPTKSVFTGTIEINL